VKSISVSHPEVIFQKAFIASEVRPVFEDKLFAVVDKSVSMSKADQLAFATQLLHEDILEVSSSHSLHKHSQ